MKKVLSIVLILVMMVTFCSCDKKEETKKDVTEEINEGTIDGYKFTVVDEVTDRVKIQMEDGGIMLIVLSNKDTPITIANFKKLVSQKFYDGLTFHRIQKDFMIQGGDPAGTGKGGLDEKIKGEFAANNVTNNLSHTKGVISMARRANDMNSASSQFFICTSDKYISSLDGLYASFGKVFAGWDTLDKLNNTEVDGETPIEKPVIKSIRFIKVEAL